jgi:RNA polymerase-binding protein DksA
MATKTKSTATAKSGANSGLKNSPNIKRASTPAPAKTSTRAARPKTTTVSNTKTSNAKSASAKVKAQRSDLDLKHFRDLLIEERKRLEEELEQVRNRHTDMDNALPEEGEGGDEDTADLASAMQDKEFDLSVEDEIMDILNQVDRAFQKFEEGTYGICDVSGKDIPANRLEAIPYATLTVECQSLSEG